MASRDTIEFVLRVQGDQAVGAFKAVNAEGAKLTNTLQTTQQGAGRAKEAMEGLAAALGVVSPELANAVRMASALVGGLKGVASAGASLAPILGPVAVVVGALGLAYSKLSSDLEKATDKMKAQAEMAEKMQQALDPSSTVSGRGGGGPAKALEERLKIERAAIDAARQGLGDIEGRSGPITARTRATLQGELAGAETRAGGLERALAGIDAKVAAAAAKGTAAGAQAGVARGLLTGADPNSLTGIMAGASSDLDARSAYADYQAYFGGALPPGIVTSANATTGLSTSMDAGLPAITAAAPRFSTGDKIGAAMGVMQGDLSGLLGMAGPVGMGVGAIANVGKMGATGVADQLGGFKDAVISGMEALPEIIGEVIPDFVSSLITDLIPALIETFPDLAKAIAIDLPIALARAILDALRSILPGGDAETGFLGKTANTVMDMATLGATKAAGVGVGRGGGSSRVDSSGRSVGGAQRGGGTVVVQGSVFGSMDTFTRDLDQHLGYGGRGRSAVMGR